MHGLAFDSVVASLFAVAAVLVGPFLLIRYQLTWPAATAEQRAEAEQIAWKYGRPLGLLQAAWMTLIVAMALSGRLGAGELIGHAGFPAWFVAVTAALWLPAWIIAMLAHRESAAFMKANGASDDDVTANLGYGWFTTPFGSKSGELSSALIMLPFVVGFVALGLWAVLPPY